MNIYDATIKQLRRAVSIKEQIANLTRELRIMFEPPADQRRLDEQKGAD
jgi:hypothetical protein